MEVVKVNEVKRRFTPETHPVVAVDLDSTLWTEDFPKMGVLYPHAVDTVNKMLEVGYEVILWTARGGDVLEESVANLGENGLNIHHPNFTVNVHAKYYTDKYPVQSQKVSCHVLIDNLSYNAPDYSNYWHILYKEFIGEDIL